jgi:flagellar biosynthesis protein FliR
MMLSMPASFVLLLWAVAVGVLMWRLSPQLAERHVGFS